MPSSESNSNIISATVLPRQKVNSFPKFHRNNESNPSTACNLRTSGLVRAFAANFPLQPRNQSSRAPSDKKCCMSSITLFPQHIVHIISWHIQYATIDDLQRIHTKHWRRKRAARWYYSCNFRSEFNNAQSRLADLVPYETVRKLKNPRFYGIDWRISPFLLLLCHRTGPRLSRTAWWSWSWKEEEKPNRTQTCCQWKRWWEESIL